MIAFSYPPDYFNDKIPAIWQNPREFYILAHLMSEYGVKSLLEIGVGYGMTFPIYRKLGMDCLGIDSHPKTPDKVVFIGNSTDPKAITWAVNLGPFDAIFVDGDHTFEGVEADFQNYFPLAQRLFIFHDISSNQAEPYPTNIGVKQFWDSIKKHFPTIEIRDLSPRDYGVGIIVKGAVDESNLRDEWRNGQH